MKIGILTQWYPPEPGSASVPGVLARALSDRGHDVSVVTGFPNYPLGRVQAGYRIRRRTDERDGATAIRRVALYPSHDRSKLRRFVNYGSFAVSATLSATTLLREMDALWVYNSPATIGLPSAAASARGGPPHLMHVMDLWPDSILYSGLAGGAAYRAMEKVLSRWCAWTYERSASIACISQGILDELVARGVSREKLRHVPLWTDEVQYQPREPNGALVEELGLGQAFTLLYAGNLGEAQGLDGLLDACARLRGIDDLRLLIAGSGTAEARLRAKADRLGLANVVFLGRWPADDMGRLLSVADLALVSLSADRLTDVTMPSKLPAILASARPVLAWASGEVARTVRAAGCGFVAQAGDVDDLEDAIRVAHSTGRPALRQLGAAGARYYRRLSLDVGASAVEGLLSTISARGPSSSALVTAGVRS